MNRIILSLIPLVTLLTACSGPGTPVVGIPYDPAAPRFPSTSGESLNKRLIQIPAGLDAEYNILMVAFLQRQQEDVDTWLPTASEIAADHANVEYYELPTVRDGGPFFKWFLDNGMRSGIPAFAARERTITLYVNTAEFRTKSGIEGEDRIWTGIVTRDGKVHWSFRGPATPQALEELKRMIRQLAAPSAP